MREGRELVGGDILMLPHGAAHVLYDGSGNPPSHIYNRSGPAGWIVSECDGHGDRVDMLSGHFFVEAPHGRLFRDYLPEIIVAQAAERSGDEGTKSASNRLEIGRSNVGTPVTNAHPLCRFLLTKKKNTIESDR